MRCGGDVVVRLVIEGLRVAKSQSVAAAFSVLVCAAVCLGIVVTRGETLAQQTRVAGLFDTEGGRVVTVIDGSPVGQLDTDFVDRVTSLGGVDWVIGLGDARDVGNARIVDGPLTTARHVFGSSPFIIYGSINGGMCGAFVSRDAMGALGLQSVAGAVRYADGEVETVCGSVQLRSGGVEVGADVLVRDAEWTGPVRRVSVGVRDATRVTSVADALDDLLGVRDRSNISIAAPEGLLNLRSLTNADNERFGRLIVLGAVAGGVFINSLLIYYAVNSRRRDFGRRRALGATRSQMCLLVVVQFLSSAGIGSLLGCIVGAAVVDHRIGQPPSGDFLVAVAFLVLTTSTLSSLLPAAVASRRDPLLVLRTP